MGQLIHPNAAALLSYTRNAPILSEDQITTRAALMVPDSLDGKQRQVSCVLTTEDPVMVYDWRSGKLVLETLIVAGCKFESQTPLLRDHRQYSVDAILGSVTGVKAEKDELLGDLTFGEDLDPQAEAIWKRVEQGHLRRGSIGYDYTREDFDTVPAGESKTIAGRRFTAPKQYDLRVVFRWRLREFSMVVIPADARAQMRSEESPQRGTDDAGWQSSEGRTLSRNSPSATERNVNELLKFLRSHGLPADQTPEDNAAAFKWAKKHLDAKHYRALHDLVEKHSIEGFCADDFPLTQPSGERTVPPRQDAPATIDPDAVRRDERQRQTAIRELAAQFPTVDAATVTRCLDQGLSIDQSRSEFLEAFRGSRSAPVPQVPTGAPAGHVRGGLNLRTLQAGLLARCGFTPDSVCLADPVAEQAYSRSELDLGWLRGAGRQGDSRNAVESAWDAAATHRLASGSFMRFCEGLIQLQEGYRTTWSEDEILERAFSSGNFAALFGSVVHLMMIQGYTSTPATYQEFCRIKDVPDFRANKEGMVNGVGRLKKQGKNGGQAALLNIDDPTIAQVAAERYAGMLMVNDQVIINDSFDVIDQLPMEVGISARQIPGDLAFAVVLGNPTLSDAAAFYVDGTNWITAGTLDEDGLSAANALLKNQKIGNKRIVITESVLLHGTTLATSARKLLVSSTTSDGAENVMRGTYRGVEDNAIDLGVDDPANDDETIAGKPASYFLFGNPKRSMVMAFRRGTNRGPVTRTGRLPVGEFGVGWDVYMDVGVAATSRVGTVRVDVS